MLTFILTAAHNIVQPQSSRHIDRGQAFTIHINKMKTTPVSLLINLVDKLL
jgi:hypothetical protein